MSVFTFSYTCTIYNKMQLLNCYIKYHVQFACNVYIGLSLNILHNLTLQIYMTQKRRQRIQELLEKQEKLKSELADAKRILMIDPTTWIYDRELASLLFFSCYILHICFDGNQAARHSGRPT